MIVFYLYVVTSLSTFLRYSSLLLEPGPSILSIRVILLTSLSSFEKRNLRNANHILDRKVRKLNIDNFTQVGGLSYIVSLKNIRFRDI